MAEHGILADLGRVVADRRRELTIDQAKLAEQIGKSASYLSRIEAGLVIPSLETTADIADALRTDRAPLQRLALGAQVVKLAGSHLDLEGLRTALRYLSDDGSPLEAAFRR